MEGKLRSLMSKNTFTKNLTGTSILKLNAYCLFEIFKQIQNNCELSENKDRYRDLIYFALSNDYFRSVFLDWIDDLSTKLEVKKAFPLTREIVCFNLAEIYESLKTYTTSEKQKFWDIVCTSLTENSRLRECFLVYESDSFYSEHMDIFERITKVLQTKRSLIKLHLYMPRYSAENLEDFRNLQCLLLIGHWFDVLADIAPYCKNIQLLNIRMKPGSNSLEYAPLAQLPNLTHFGLGGHPEAGSLGALFKSMADNGSRTLTTLLVAQPIESGIAELSRLHQLQSLECELKVPPSDLSPTHSWRWPTICALDLKMDSKKDVNLNHISMDILTSNGVLILVSKNMGFIKQIILRRDKWLQHRCLSSNSESTPMWFEINEKLESLESLMSEFISDPKDIVKIATFALENQWPTYAQNIQLLARISDLKELRVKVKLNIERELMRLGESDMRYNVEDFETEIPIDSDTQEIINLALLTYLGETLVRSKFANIKSDIFIRRLEMEIKFDIRP